MSQEIRNTTTFAYNKNGATRGRTGVTTVQDATGNAVVDDVQSIGTSDETLDKGDIGTIGFLYAKNLDALHYIDIGADGSTYPIRLQPGVDCRTPWNSSAVHAKANTAACLLDYVVIEQ